MDPEGRSFVRMILSNAPALFRMRPPGTNHVFFAGSLFLQSSGGRRRVANNQVNRYKRGILYDVSEVGF
jgi:hypothetical protein